MIKRKPTKPRRRILTDPRYTKRRVVQPKKGRGSYDRSPRKREGE